MTEKELFLVAKDATNDCELKNTEIPSIDLYVDQIINLVSAKLDGGSQRYKDLKLTKTMINNYSKDGLITPVKGKKYNKEQILQMLTVYSLKNTISIGEIKRLLDGAYSVEGFDGAALDALYGRHQEIKQDNREYSVDLLSKIIDKNRLNVEDDIDYILTVCALVSLSAELKNIARAMIDEKYPVPIESEEEETDKELKKKGKKERKEEKKEAKEEKKEEKRERRKKEASEQNAE